LKNFPPGANHRLAESIREKLGGGGNGACCLHGFGRKEKRKCETSYETRGERRPDGNFRAQLAKKKIGLYIARRRERGETKFGFRPGAARESYSQGRKSAGHPRLIYFLAAC